MLKTMPLLRWTIIITTSVVGGAALARWQYDPPAPEPMNINEAVATAVVTHQQKRESIQQAIRDGELVAVDLDRDDPIVTVDGAFLDAPASTQKRLMELVAGYCVHAREIRLVGRDGEPVGEYSSAGITLRASPNTSHH